jgi:hypothetical protein
MAYIFPALFRGSRRGEMVSRRGEIVSSHGEIFFFLHVPNTLPYFRFRVLSINLTTPPCTESVIWTIFPDIVYISQYQVNIEENKINLKGHGVGSNLSFQNASSSVDRHVALLGQISQFLTPILARIS